MREGDGVRQLKYDSVCWVFRVAAVQRDTCLELREVEATSARKFGESDRKLAALLPCLARSRFASIPAFMQKTSELIGI